MFTIIKCSNPDIFLTSKELEVIFDRLDMSCCLYDAFDEEYPEEQVDQYISEIHQYFKNSQLLNNTSFTDDAFDVLCECVDGSTYLSNVVQYYEKGQLSKGSYCAVVRVCNSIEKKFKTLGYNVTFPRC